MNELSETWYTLLAQGDGGPEIGGGSTPDTTTTGQDGGAGGGTGGGGSPGMNPFDMMWPLILVLVVVMVWASFRQRREQKKRDEMIGSIKKRDTVQTIGGVIGSVVEVKSNTVVLKVDESSNTRMTFARSAIQQVVTESPDKEADEEPANTE